MPGHVFFDVQDRLYLCLMILITRIKGTTLVIPSKRAAIWDGISWRVCQGFDVALAVTSLSPMGCLARLRCFCAESAQRLRLTPFESGLERAKHRAGGLDQRGLDLS